jgi:hypothetical protein
MLVALFNVPWTLSVAVDFINFVSKAGLGQMIFKISNDHLIG